MSTTLRPTAEAINSPGLSSEPLEVRLVRAILATEGEPIQAVSPYAIGPLADAAFCIKAGTYNREALPTDLTDFQGLELADDSPLETRVAITEFAIREAFEFIERTNEVKHNGSLWFELHCLVVRELAILLREWDELTGQAPSKEVA